MNIFLFCEDLDKNAAFFKKHDPKRFNKQIVESTQLFAASMKQLHNIPVLKADGTPYTVNRILHHPACKWVMNNHQWHIRYLISLLKLSPTHACCKSVQDALSHKVQIKLEETTDYLCITNSDMTTFNVVADNVVFSNYLVHIANKWIKDGRSRIEVEEILSSLSK